MKAVRGSWLWLGLATLLAVSGCTIAAGPAYYPPAGPPPCPAGYYWSPGYGCVPLPVGVVVPPDAVYAVVSTDGLSLRSCPGTKCGIINSLNAGEQVQVLGHEGGWTHVWAFTRGQEGWVGSKHLD
uniref:SH3 domain-containing protein n=1 Tax=Desulfovibrio sp. U5L TaxID=596152 RepID=I2Q1Z5_9BACT